MSNAVISVEEVSKKYLIGRRLGGYSTLRDAIASSVSASFRRFHSVLSSTPAAGRTSQSIHEFWALKDVSFEVGEGDVIGIIGKNGAGKSTLLKILSRITRPTSGRVRIRGRVASLLEVGTGFHAELTGRENIFLNGAILGMKRNEIKRKFDEIVAFAEVEQFLDTPVKRYSSGMYVRLAFAVAAHLDPEILLVDEVLAVGDSEFQKKCLGKMDSVARQGRTVFLVSHNTTTISRLCNSVIVLSQGRVTGTDRPDRAIAGYIQQSLSQGAAVEFDEGSHLVKSPLQIRKAAVLSSAGTPSDTLLLGSDVCIMLTVQVAEQVSQARIGLGLYAEGVRLGTIHTPPIDFPQPGLHVLTCKLPGSMLLPNFYTLHAGAYSSDTGRSLDWITDALSFRIEPVSGVDAIEYDDREHGLIKLAASWDGDVLGRFPNHAPWYEPLLTSLQQDIDGQA
jgi:lipopolysaccharide transport system ATP-binding protein